MRSGREGLPPEGLVRVFVLDGSDCLAHLLQGLFDGGGRIRIVCEGFLVAVELYLQLIEYVCGSVSSGL